MTLSAMIFELPQHAAHQSSFSGLLFSVACCVYVCPGGVLVHCLAGMSRSASICIAYMMWKQRLSYIDVSGGLNFGNSQRFEATAAAVLHADLCMSRMQNWSGFRHNNNLLLRKYRTGMPMQPGWDTAVLSLKGSAKDAQLQSGFMISFSIWGVLEVHQTQQVDSLSAGALCSW